jgi:hypothetical protein
MLQNWKLSVRKRRYKLDFSTFYSTFKRLKEAEEEETSHTDLLLLGSFIYKIGNASHSAPLGPLQRDVQG